MAEPVQGRCATSLYQIEVKRFLVQFFFHPANGWKVGVDVGPTELAPGAERSADKAQRSAAALAALKELGARIGPDPRFGRVDVVADHPKEGLRLIEVAGKSSRPEQAVYLALGQLLMSMKIRGPAIRYGLAVPLDPRWERQLRKLPPEVTRLLAVDLYLIGSGSATHYKAGEAMPSLARG